MQLYSIMPGIQYSIRLPVPAPIDNRKFAAVTAVSRLASVTHSGTSEPSERLASSFHGSDLAGSAIRNIDSRLETKSR